MTQSLVVVDEPCARIRAGQVGAQPCPDARQSQPHVKRRHPVAVTAVDRLLGSPEGGERLAALAYVGELRVHHPGEQAPPAMGRQDADDSHACTRRDRRRGRSARTGRPPSRRRLRRLRTRREADRREGSAGSAGRPPPSAASRSSARSLRKRYGTRRGRERSAPCTPRADPSRAATADVSRVETNGHAPPLRRYPRRQHRPARHRPRRSRPSGRGRRRVRAWPDAPWRRTESAASEAGRGPSRPGWWTWPRRT